MPIRIGLRCALLFGLLLFTLGIAATLTFPEVLILTSAVALLVLADSQVTQRRMVAIEQFLTRSRPKLPGRQMVSGPLAAVPTVDECSARLRFHLSRIIGERHPKSSTVHHDDVRDLIANHMSSLGWEVRLEPVSGC